MDGPPPAKKPRPGRRKRPINGQMRTYQVRMIPTAEQKVELKRSFSAARKAYNWAVKRINSNGMSSFYTLRNEYRSLQHGDDDRPQWASNVHSTISANAVKQAHSAATAAFTNLSRGNINHFDLRYRSHKKTKSESIEIEGDPSGKHRSPLLNVIPVPDRNRTRLRDECLAMFGGNLKKTGGIRLQDTHHVISKLLGEGNHLSEGCKIHWEKRTDSYYFLYTYDCAPPAPDPDPQFETKRLVATDLGAEPFAAWYSPTEGGTHGELLWHMREKLERRCIDLDKRVSKVAQRGQNYRDTAAFGRSRKQRYKTFHRMKQTLAKEQLKLRNWMKAAHYSAANFLLRRFDVLVVPKLRIPDMVRREGRVFGSKTARAMYTWSHSKFVERLESAAFRYSGRHVCSDATEPGTSKTCGNCQWWHANLGGNKTYNCAHCGLRMHRDVNGARNNFLAYLGRCLGAGWDGVVVQATGGH